ncbi:flagellar biosynthesis protein [Microcella daejeonensis]|uniref:sugar-transfer associated ATP-grasp domain-containing protein n=1 Tax=Microcella daejeonensis TaxID=2994971 RepID=UPI0022709BE3|nr:sugar-transfer associated ATP-grasp domain-containing protein [Microcella daejeonensis]WAB83307.1 flagellar biosynthesis protein [Microcella daejeonensis]
MAVSLRARARYLAKRARSFRLGRVWGFATQISKEQGKHPVPVLIDMLYSAAFRDTAYLDYYEADFALLTRAERATFMTSLLQHHLAEALNDREAAKTFENKIAFNTAFAEFLHREWIDLSTAGVDELRSFAERHPVIIAKVPVSREGKGVFRYDTAEVSEWTAFHADLVSKGQVLIEQPIVQHPYLAKYCAGTVNTTRITTYFDGETVRPLVIAQKFGRGAVSDQFTWGGFFTMLDENGRAVGPGHTGRHVSRYETHPDSGESIVDFQLPLWDEALAMLDEAARRIPAVPYVGWDVAIGPDGPVLLEGNWTPGLYETRVSATGIRHGTRPLHDRAFRDVGTR